MSLVLFVVNDAGFFVSHRLALAVGVRNAGHDVHVALPSRSASVDAAGIPTHVVTLHRSSVSPRGEVETIRQLVNLYRELAPTLVHHVTAKPILYGGIAARVAQVPAVVHAVTGLGYAFIDPRPRARAIRFLVRRSYTVATSHPNCAVIFQNEDDRAMFAPFLRSRFTEIIPGSGVDTTRFRPSPLPKSAPPMIVLPARMLGDKGVREFVAAARDLRGRARFVLVGGLDASNPNAIPEHELKAWSDEGAVEWWGHRDDMPSVLAEATIVCLPSYREGMPKALLEACVVGRPIVTTDVPGCRHAVEPSFSRLVPARDGRALSNALGELLASDLTGMAARAAEHGARRFAVAGVVSATLGVYRELLEFPQTGRIQLARSPPRV